MQVNTIKDKDIILNWLRDLDCYSEYRETMKDGGRYSREKILDSLLHIKHNWVSDSGTHNPQTAEYYDLQIEDYDFVVVGLMQYMTAQDKEEGINDDK